MNANVAPTPTPSPSAPPTPVDPAAIDQVRLGIAAYNEGRRAEAFTLYAGALAREPAYFDALNNLGVGLRADGRLEASLAWLGRAARAWPTRPEGHFNLGNALVQGNQLEAAALAYGEALRLAPDYHTARRNLALLLGRLQRIDEELAHRRHLARAQPLDFDNWSNMGSTLYGRGQIEAALAATRRAVMLKPDHLPALKNLSIILVHRGDYAEAAACLGQAISTGLTDASFVSALGQTLVQLGELDAAGVCFTRALATDPNLADAKLGAARVSLLRGDLTPGLAAYEDRWSVRPYPQNMPKPAWKGEDPAGKRILVWAEQGFGDTLNFARYAAPLAARGAEVIFLVQPPMVGLMRTVPGVSAVFGAGAPTPDHDLHAPLMSLPHLMGTTLATIPTLGPYVFTPDKAAARGIPGLEGPDLKVGLVWAGNPEHKNDRNRSAGLKPFLHLCGVPGVRFLSLQKGPPVAQLEETGGGLMIEDLEPHLTSFEVTAAVLDKIDLLISVDTAVVHLAGAMGRPVWCLLPYAPDWRWLLWRSDTPWYPTMRLIRQPKPNDWASAFDEARRALVDLVAGRRAATQV